MFYDFKEIKYTVRQEGGGLVKGTFTGNIGFRRPQSQAEAEKMATEWLQNKKHPNCEVIELEVTLR